MAPCSWNNNGGLLFRTDNPHFLKIITSHSKKLGIPRKFVINYGDDLSSHVFLKVPSGVKWKVDIVKRDGEIWLRNGWRKFAEYYSVVEGSLLVFEYVTSDIEFNVFIFDKTATEIDYPFSLSNERPTLDHEQLPLDTNVVVDDELESDVSGEISPSNANFDDQFQNLQRGETTLNQNGEAEGNIKQPKEKESSSKEPKLNGTNPTRLVNVSIIRDKKKAESQVPEVECTRSGILSDISRKRKEKSPLTSPRPHKIAEKGTNTEEKKEKNKAIHTASYNCQSEIPTFEIKMQPSYVHHCRCNLEIPVSFATKYMKKKDGDALLSVLDGKTWSIKYYIRTRACGQTRTRLLHSGWNEFAQDNHLQVGDVCKFELIDPHKTHFRVAISRITIGANAEPENQREKALTWDEKAMLVQRAVSNFRSENPSFIVVMQPSYVYTSNTLAIPSSFARKYLKKKGDAIFNILDGRSWSVKYYFSTASEIRIKSSGCSKFIKDNDLRVGDVCIFELLLEYVDKTIFRVAISKYSKPSTSHGASKQSKDKESCSEQPKLSSDNPKRQRVGSPCNISNENRTRKKIKLQSSERTSNRDNLGRQVEGRKNTRAMFKFSSQNPTFERTMQPSNFKSRTTYFLELPRKFVKNMENGNHKVKLQIGNRLWSVKLHIYPYRVVFGEGWFDFTWQNSLKTGDVCTFELIDKEVLLIKVSISRD